MANQAPGRDGKKLVRHRKCLVREEQEKNGAAGFNGVAGCADKTGTGLEYWTSKESSE
jgi:hypothetical protein